MSRKLLLAAAAAVFLSLPAPAPANAAAPQADIVMSNGQFCHGHQMVTSRTGLAIKKSKAEKRARRKWKERVWWLMPGSWGQADWGKAKARSYSCHKKLGTWRCKASAIPCA